MKITGTGIVRPGEPEEQVVDGRKLLLRRATPPATVPPREARRLTRAALLAVAACKEALGDRATGGSTAVPEVEGLGIALGSGFGSVEATRAALEGLFERADLLSPTHFVASVRHDAASVAARLLTLRGPSVATSARRLSFEQALGWALVQLRRGRAPAMLVAGTDEVSPVLARSLARARLRREPIVWGEGAGALLLERDDSPRPALARIGRFVEGAGSVEDLLAALGRMRADVVFTDEDGAARRAEDARRIVEVVGGERRAVSDAVGHIAAGGALAAVEAVRSGAQRALVYAREPDGPFAAYVVEGVAR